MLTSCSFFARASTKEKEEQSLMGIARAVGLLNYYCLARTRTISAAHGHLIQAEVSSPL